MRGGGMVGDRKTCKTSCERTALSLVTVSLPIARRGCIQRVQWVRGVEKRPERFDDERGFRRGEPASGGQKQGGVDKQGNPGAEGFSRDRLRLFLANRIFAGREAKFVRSTTIIAPAGDIKHRQGPTVHLRGMHGWYNVLKG